MDRRPPPTEWVTWFEEQLLALRADDLSRALITFVASDARERVWVGGGVDETESEGQS